MRSAVYTGKVLHHRHHPEEHRLAYSVYSLLLDLDELDQLSAGSRWFSLDRFNLFSFHVKDHGPRDGSALRPWAQELLAEAGVHSGDGHIQLLTYPRILGYGFSPLTVWYCHDDDDRLVAVIHEVRNTFGEHHSYVVPINDDSATIRHSTDKVFHVSPFFDVAGRYEFTLRPPGKSVSVIIDYTTADQHLLRASFSGRRSEFNSRILLRRFFDHPLLSFKVVAGIHWEALKLLRKRVGYRSKPPPPSAAVTHVPVTHVPVNRAPITQGVQL